MSSSLTTTTLVIAGAPSSSSSDSFDTPTLDAEFSSILQSISEHGGYAFVGMASLAASGDMRAAEVAREMSWEQLHSGPWHSVLPVWRDAYAMACLQVARFHFAGGELKEALRVLDMGLIMGGTLLRTDLYSAVEKVSAKAGATRALTAEKGCQSSDTVRAPSAFQSVQRGGGEMHPNLPIGALSSKIVSRRAALSLEGFLCEYLLPGFPVIISDCMEHWPARTKWNDLDYLKSVAGDRTVPVEVGKNYLCPEWKQELITFSQLLDRMQSNSQPHGLTYLAQHPLFDQINDLREDIFIPEYCFVSGGELRSVNAWFGPAGTVTPLHQDPHHNILAQVVGRKYVRLYAASISEELHPYTDTMLCNSSQVDLDNVDERVFPEVKGLEFMDCILDEGEMLYIPPRWWHYVRSLTTSFSVSFWWSNNQNPTLS